MAAPSASCSRAGGTWRPAPIFGTRPCRSATNPSARATSRSICAPRIGTITATNATAQFNDVILHVVLWEAGSRHVPRTRAGQIIPQIVIQHQLDSPLEQLYDDIDLDSYPHNVGNHHGQCAHVLAARCPPTSLGALLDAAGDERFAAKVRRFSALDPSGRSRAGVL